ncbi:MAG: hypothetical protein IH851_08240 [Armatimonadetes bacterium]|nr:hypothetical protein [Armatimonadota bacterium]
MITTAIGCLLTAASVTGSIVVNEPTEEGWTISFAGSDEMRFEQTTDSDGRFSLSGMPPGTYEVRIRQGRRTITIPILMLEDGQNELRLFWPPAFDETERLDSARTAFQEGSIDLSGGEYGRAAERFLEALQWDTAQAPVWAALALSQVGAERYEEALNSGMMALRLAPGEAAYHNNVGSTLFRMRKYAQAVPRYRRAAELNPDGRGLYLSNSAAALIALGHDRDAAAAYEQAVKDPNVPVTSWFHYGALLTRIGPAEDAKRALLRYLELDPGGPYAQPARKRLRSLGEEPPP